MVDLCNALADAAPGSSREIVTSGIYVRGMEASLLYAVPCNRDVQPAAWVELSPAAQEQLSLANIDGSHKVRLVVRGILYGLELAREDVGTLRVEVPRSVGRHGHLNGFRAKLFVVSVETAESARDVTLPRLSKSAIENSVLLDAALPIYPSAARRYSIFGTVEVQVSIRGGQVVSANTARSGMLEEAAVSNVRTWRFASSVELDFTTRFVFKLDETLRSTNTTTVTFDLPNEVTIVSAPDRW
jgi:Gram-negative bacterial TonB protein C-terminal